MDSSNEDTSYINEITLHSANNSSQSVHSDMNITTQLQGYAQQTAMNIQDYSQLIDKVIPIRMPEYEELVGADLVEHGIHHTGAGVSRALSALGTEPGGPGGPGGPELCSVGFNPGHDLYIEKYIKGKLGKADRVASSRAARSATVRRLVRGRAGSLLTSVSANVGVGAGVSEGTTTAPGRDSKIATTAESYDVRGDLKTGVTPLLETLRNARNNRIYAERVSARLAWLD